MTEENSATSSLVGTTVWVPDSDIAWTKAVVEEKDDSADSAYRVKVLSKQTLKTIDRQNIKVCNQFEDGIAEVNHLVDVTDLTTLTHLHEPALLEALCQRFNRNRIYTNTGPILIAVNPFQNIPGMYSEELLINYYTSGLSFAGKEGGEGELPPHIYKAADHAYRSMKDPELAPMEETEEDMEAYEGGESLEQSRISNFSAHSHRNQSILVSGESGAGKTESTKHIMNYLATVANTQAAAASIDLKDLGLGSEVEAAITEQKSETGDADKERVADMVLKSNPILESFGNARTIRNDNSSRFGKFIEMQFNFHGYLVGARIKTYLLEKVRINKQALNERNYHIYYQLFKGAEGELRKLLCLDELGLTLQTCNLTNQSKCYERKDGVKDQVMYEGMVSAMKTMKFTEEEIHNLLKIVSGLMHLSNLSFTEKLVDGNVGSNISRAAETSTERVTIVSKLLGLTSSASDQPMEELMSKIENALTKRKRIVNREVFENVLTPKDAEHARNAVIKTVYSRMFNWIVHRVNQSIEYNYNSPKAGSPQTHESSLYTSMDGDNYDELSFIGVLDIFGFEVFEQNSFEQLCINYANETLQQQFNHFIFKLEQLEYQKEKIEWSFITFPDNEKVLRLIDGKPIGVLSLLDEQCLFPNGNDEKLARKLYERLETDKQAESGEEVLFSASRKEKVDFKFCINHYAGLVQYDTLGFCEKNKDHLFQEALDLLQTTENSLLKILFPMGETTESSSNSKAAGSKSIQAITVGTQFKNQLGELLEVIKSTHPHYVRCLKPNDENVKAKINKKRLVDQLRYGGVLEAVKVARAGYPVRMKLVDFLKRYVHQAEVSFDPNKQGDKEHRSLVEQMVAEFKLELKEEYQIGLTKVFLRKNVYERLEQRRGHVRKKAALLIQQNLRMFSARRSFLAYKHAALLLQRQLRMVAAKQRVESIRQTVNAIKLQRIVRGFLISSVYKRKQASILVMQRCVRVSLAKEKLRQAKLESRAVRLQAYGRRLSARLRFVRLRSAVISLQTKYRARVAKEQLKHLRKEAKEVGNLQGKVDEFRSKMKSLSEELRKEKENRKNLETIIEDLECKCHQLEEAEQQKTSRENGDEETQILRDQLTQQRAENTRMLSDMEQMKKRVEELEAARADENAGDAFNTAKSSSQVGVKVVQETVEEPVPSELSTEEDRLETEVDYWKNKMGSIDTDEKLVEDTTGEKVAEEEEGHLEELEKLREENKKLAQQLEERAVETAPADSDEVLVELSKKLMELETENQRLESMLEARGVSVGTASGSQPSPSNNAASEPGKTEESANPLTEATSQQEVSEASNSKLAELEQALQEMAQENKDYKRANFDMQERISSYITKMCDAENRANELDADLQKKVDHTTKLEATHVQMLKQKVEIERRLKSMEVITEQASGVKIALAKRLEELLVEKKKLQSFNKKLREKIAFTNDTNKVLTQELQSYKMRMKSKDMGIYQK